MRWDAVIEGQPPSLNHSYANRTIPLRKKGVVQYDELSGEQKQRRIRVLTDEAEAYRNGAQMIFQSRKPSGWRPTGQIRVMFDLMLEREIDDDNALKLLYDALKRATGYDDKNYLHCVRSKETGHAHPYVIVTVDDDPRHP